MEGRALNRPLGLDTFRMAFDSATVFTAQALPTPTGAPRQTPSRQSSQHDRRRRSSSPPPVPRDQSLQHENQKEVQNGQGDENISPLDPRRFTPTLHASLVSQILNLQREVESKNRTVHNLEEFLHITKKENEQLSESLKDQGKENRSIKKQMQLLESSTLDALGGIAKERDDANESLAETRSRLETSKSKNRIQEEEVERNQSLWDKERQNWEMERRNMETKVHVVEGRLKTVLAEIAAAQANGYEYPLSSVELDDSAHRTWYTKESDSTSSRSNSVKRHSRFSGLSNGTNEVSEYLNYRASTLSGLNGFGMNKRHGISLADELEFSAEEPDFEGDGTDEVMSPDALPEEAQFHRRRPSVQSISQDQKAWKLLGLLPENIEQAIKEEGLTEKTAAALQDNVTLTEKPSTEDERMSSAPTATAMQYVDSATQFSPPASPKLAPQAESIPSEKVAERALSIEHTANQSRKRVSAPLTEQTTDPKLISHTFVPMVSAGCQTVNQPPSPPLTPIIAIEPLASAPMRTESEVQMISSSMQTDEQRQIILAAAGAREKPSSMTIPVIEIHPPGSRPPSSHTSVVLPPRTKNAGCQASIVLPVLSRSISVQTEAVITGKRSLGSISNSMPKAVSQLSSPPNSLERIEERSPQPPQPAPRTSSRKHSHRSNENPRPLIKPSFSAPVIDTYPGNNDSGPLTSKQPTGLRRPVRSGSLFAGFDSSFTNDSLQLKDFDLSSDDDFATVAPIRKTLSKVQNSWKLVPQSDDEFMGRLGSAKNSVDNLDIDESSDPWLASLVPFGENENQIYKGIDKQTGKKSMIPSKTHGKSGMRQAAPLATAPGPKVPRARSPSAPSVPENDSNVAPPPFPVPTRSSSRRIPISASEGAQSPTPYSTTFFSTARKREVGKPLSRNPLRKVQSAAAVTRFGRNHAQMRTPTHTTSPSTLASDSPQLPKLPKNDITSRLKTDMQPVQQTTHILPVASLAEEASVDTPGQSTSVVDAIAQTMVGEWMWKYVRRRKSFGLTEDVDFDEKGNSNGNGFRHKRWVWLAPYERAVMWSSKQPTSGPALMGKSGRKRKYPETFSGAASNLLQSTFNLYSTSKTTLRCPNLPIHRRASADLSSS